jgi:4-hydroxy-3-methylbut-2-en-1-yl diphosphate reductase
MVQDVIESLREIGPVRVTNLPGVEENVEFRLPVELQSV